MARRLRNYDIETGNDRSVAFVDAGFNYRMTIFQGAIGRAQTQRLPALIPRRRELAALYVAFLAESGAIELPARMDYGFHVFQIYDLVLPARCDRAEVIAGLMQRGFESNRGAYPINEQPYYKRKYGHKHAQFENACITSQRGLALPLHDGMSRRDVRRIAETLFATVQEVCR